MLFKVYDTDYEYVGTIDKPFNVKVETSLKTGTKSLSFDLPLTKTNIELITEEGYIETKDYNYIIKEIEMKKNNLFSVYCKPNIEDLTGVFVPVYDIFDSTPNQCITKIIELTSWTVNFNINYPNKVQYAIDKRTAWELLEQIKTDFEFEYWFDTKAKKLEVYAAAGIGDRKGNVLMNELRLAALDYRSQTYDFATVLYPYGKKGLSISDVNNGKPYIENYEYCNKKIAAYYIDEDIEYADDLKRIAESYLRIISTPVMVYRAHTTHLPANLQIGDSIYIIDNIKKKKIKKRVVKITQYLDQPEKDTIELDNEVENISKLFYQFQDEYRKKIRYITKNISELQ